LWWSALAGTGPSPRGNAAMEYDGEREQLVLHGGVLGPNVLGDTWTFGTPRPCYVNCDGSTAPPVLNINDFLCFMSRYSAGCP
jgi:hypothetical protein